MALPGLDRNACEEQMRAEFERALREVADAVDNAPQGRVIRDSEEKARDAFRLAVMRIGFGRCPAVAFLPPCLMLYFQRRSP